jgi:uncharacterized protein YecT (DUF1311 family)
MCTTRIAPILVYCLALCWTSVGYGMEFTKHLARNGIAIKATGAIVEGDAIKLQLIASEASVDDKGLRRIILESPGGSVAEAMRIATVIRANDFVTLVGGECASACAAVLYPAGRYFMLLDSGKLGFHSCYDSRTLIEQPECTKSIAGFAATNGFPYGSIKVFAEPSDMYWITNVLAYCYGMERFIGDPAPVTVSVLCPSVALALISGKFHEANKPLGPSFDCKKAFTPAAELLCKDRELMHLDALMGKLYRMMRKREGMGAHSALLEAQREWIVKRDARCNVTADAIASFDSSRNAARCISEMTMARMDELLTANGTPRQNLMPLIRMMSPRNE